MHPVLFTLCGQPIHAYLLHTGGILLAMVLAAWRCRAAGLDRVQFLNLEIAIFASLIVGSKLAYVAENPAYYARHPGEMLALWKSGFSFFGGLVFGAAGGLAYIMYARMPLGATTDFCSPYVAFGHVFGKVSCLLTGCCFGAPTGAGWGVRFPTTACDEQLRHPAQLYEMVGLIALFCLLHRLGRGRYAAGTVIAAYLVGYGALRFLLEYTRDPAVLGPSYGGLYLYQWASRATLGLGAMLMARIRPWVVR